MTGEGSGIGARLKAARERLGWSREELAFRSKLSWSAIAQVESGRRRNLRPQTLARLASALGLSSDYLIHGQPAASTLTHQALLYEDEEGFAEVTGRFLLEGLERSEAALVATHKRNLKLLRKRLGDGGGHVEFVDSGRVLKSPEATVRFFSDFMTAQLRSGAVWVRIVGEPIWTGRSADEIRLWMKHESLINLQFAGSPVSVLCPYDLGALDPEIVKSAHVTHPQTIREGEPIESLDYRDPGSFVLEP